MRRCALALVAVVVLALTACGDRRPAGDSAPSRVVASVSDGDTLRLQDGDRVRLVQIDAPELESDCYGEQARQALLRLAPPGTRVDLIGDARLDDVDRYGRLLRYVYVRGQNLNVVLVALGAAEPYFYRNERGRFAAALLRSARRAQAERRGLWRACPGVRLDPGLGSITGPA